MRMSYLVCYDISDEKRLRKVFKAMRNCGDHWQYSVCQRQLTPTNLVRCRRERAAAEAISNSPTVERGNRRRKKHRSKEQIRATC